MTYKVKEKTWISILKQEPKKGGWYRVICQSTKNLRVFKFKWKPEIYIIGRSYEGGYFHANQKRCKRPVVALAWRVKDEC